MSNTIQVSTTTLKEKAETLKSLNAKLKQQIESLSSQENSLNSMWDGESNDAFHKAFSEDVIQMNNFYNAIEKYVQTLNEIATEYEKAEQTNLNTASTRNYK